MDNDLAYSQCLATPHLLQIAAQRECGDPARCHNAQPTTWASQPRQHQRFAPILPPPPPLLLSRLRQFAIPSSPPTVFASRTATASFMSPLFWGSCPDSLEPPRGNSPLPLATAGNESYWCPPNRARQTSYAH